MGLIALRRLAVRLPAACRLAPRMLRRGIIGMWVFVGIQSTPLELDVYHLANGIEQLYAVVKET